MSEHSLRRMKHHLEEMRNLLNKLGAYLGRGPIPPQQDMTDEEWLNAPGGPYP